MQARDVEADSPSARRPRRGHEVSVGVAHHRKVELLEAVDHVRVEAVLVGEAVAGVVEIQHPMCLEWGTLRSVHAQNDGAEGNWEHTR